jgi:hypothetical protein
MIMRKAIILTLVIAMLLTGLGVSLHTAFAVTPIGLCPSGAKPITITVRSHGTPSYTHLSTSINDAVYVNTRLYSGGSAALHDLYTWHPQMVRLHFGFRGADISLPEEQYNNWNFYLPDAAIRNVRAIHVSYLLNVRSAPPWMFNKYGQLRDPTFHEFAKYMARLVAWYNKGGFYDDYGVYHKSGYSEWVHTWEIWNEPSSSYEIPVPVPDKSAPFLDPIHLAKLYNVTEAAMRAVDPSIVIGGPALSGHTDYAFADYIGPFAANLTQPLGFVSFHLYATGSITEPDQIALDRLRERLPYVIRSLQPIAHRLNGWRGAPIWLDETGFNESSRLPADPRLNSRITNTSIADTFAIATNLDVGWVDEFPFVGYAPGGLVDHNTAATHTSYWLYSLLSQTMPAGSLRLAVNNPYPQFSVMATLAPLNRAIYVLIGNNVVAHPTYDVNGYGAIRSVCLVFNNAHTGVWIPTSSRAKMWTFDGHAPNNSLPVAMAQHLIVHPDQAVMVVRLTGYSANDIQISI